MPGGILIPQINEVLAQEEPPKTKEEWRRFTLALYDTMKAIEDALPQMPIVASKGAPEGFVKATQGTILFNIDPQTQVDGVAFVKKEDEVAGDPKRGWNQVNLT